MLENISIHFYRRYR